MIALGVWQLQRKDQKEALIALFQRNSAMSATVAYPKLPPVPNTMLYRKSSVVCLEPVRWDPRSGTDQKGRAGFRMIADCRTGAEGPGVLVDVDGAVQHALHRLEAVVAVVGGRKLHDFARR